MNVKLAENAAQGHRRNAQNLGVLIVALAAGLCLATRALAADCAPPLPTDGDADAPGTDACPRSLSQLSCIETFYVRQDGTGSDPTTIQGALSPAQFNDRARWHEGAGKDGKIGAGDCVQIVGTVTGPLVVHASGVTNSPISIIGLDDEKFGKAQLVGSVPFPSTDYVWFRTTDRNPAWYTDGSKRGEGCDAGKPARCAHPGIAASLGLENCRVLWVGDHLARSSEHGDFRWVAAQGDKGDRLMLLNSALISDPNQESAQLRCAAHTGGKVEANTCGAKSSQGGYFCEGHDYPAEDFALYVGDHSYVDLRSLRVNYADFGIGFYGDYGTQSHDHGHNTASCVTFKKIDKTAVFIERQYLGHEYVYDSAIYDAGNGIYVNHPDGGDGHAFCRNYFVSVNESGRNGGDGHAVGLQAARDVAVEWNYIEKARKPIALWAWRQDPRARTTNDVRVRYNHIVGAIDPTGALRGKNDGAGIVLVSGDAVYGNEIAYNLIEDEPMNGHTSLLIGIWAGGSGSNQRAPNRFLNNTIVGAQTSFVVGSDNVLAEFRNNISYKPGGMHVRVEQGRRVTTLPSFEANLYYPVDNEHAFEMANGERVTIDQWRGAAGDAHSLIVDPLFEDEAARDYRLRESSPARRSGIGAEVPANASGVVDSDSTP